MAFLSAPAISARGLGTACRVPGLCVRATRAALRPCCCAAAAGQIERELLRPVLAHRMSR